MDSGILVLECEISQGRWRQVLGDREENAPVLSENLDRFRALVRSIYRAGVVFG
jgi:hypothetical protein